MERERHEPTFGKSDLSELRFRSNRPRPAYAEPAIPSWAMALIGTAVAVGIAMGLIEWNARRQAAALTRELMRPMTAKEEAQLKRELAKNERELAAATKAELAELQRTLWNVQAVPIAPVQPLAPGERCIQNRRYKRIDGGWRDVPDHPC